MVHSSSHRVLPCFLLAAPLFFAPAPAAAQAPTASVTIDPNVELDIKTGTATLRGTITCSADVVFDDFDVQLIQAVGRKSSLEAFAFAFEVPCTPEGTPWSFLMVADGKFSGGFAVARAHFGVCNDSECVDASAALTVHLSNGGH